MGSQIDADLPPERKSYIAKDSEALLVLTNEAQAELFGKLAHDMDDKELQGKIAQESEEALEPIADLDGLAYILYTSGQWSHSLLSRPCPDLLCRHEWQPERLPAAPPRRVLGDRGDGHLAAGNRQARD